MSQKKRIFFGFSNFSKAILCISLWSLNSVAEVQNQQIDYDRILENRINSISDKKITLQAVAKKTSLRESLANLRSFKVKADVQSVKCEDVQKNILNKRYIITLDADGKPCRVYDLTFPNIKSFFTSKKITQIPLRMMTSKDYVNWLDGDLNSIHKTNQEFNRQFNAKEMAKKSWISKLKFKKTPKFIPGSQNLFRTAGIPQSFSLADLDLGNNFRFNPSELAEAQASISEPKLMSLNVGGVNLVDNSNDAYLKMMSQPETILKAIKFNWNDLDKVYDVILDGDFLPVTGPVALIDYQTQYKYAVDKTFRSILGTGLEQLSRLIPNKLISSIVEVVVSDLFEQMELMYDYQTLQLEQTLRVYADKPNRIQMDTTNLNQALDLLYGQRSDLFSSYIMSVAQQKEFNWQAFEKMGKTARYTAEKQRDIMMSKTNSSLVLDKKCTTEFYQDYFAICSRNGKRDGIYSLISEQSLMMKNFGAPLIYRFDRPYETSLVRGTTWILSIAVRIFGLPLSRGITYQLNSILKGFMHAGISDEALLKGKLIYDYQNSKTSKEENDILKWLYIQNLNPFLPKSMNSELNLIEKNKIILGVDNI